MSLLFHFLDLAKIKNKKQKDKQKPKKKNSITEVFANSFIKIKYGAKRRSLHQFWSIWSTFMALIKYTSTLLIWWTSGFCIILVWSLVCEKWWLICWICGVTFTCHFFIIRYKDYFNQMTNVVNDKSIKFLGTLHHW